MKKSFEMPKRRDRNMFKALSFFSVFTIGLLVATGSQAATMQILFDDLDVTYSSASGNIEDLGDPDTLYEVNFTVDGNEVGTVLNGTLDLVIPGVPAIASGANSILQSSSGGSVALDLGGGDFLDLTLDEVTVVYIHATNSIQFVAAGSVATIDSQQLPFGLLLGDPVSLTFSTRVDTSSEANGFITDFTASGTGEISGAAVPEPTSLGLLALGGLLGSMAAYRYRLG